MNWDNLYIGEDYRGESTYYNDVDCTKPYTGHVENYFKGVLSWEFDVIDGIQNGIEKTYYKLSGELESINEVKDNMHNGLSIDYYKNGKISAIYTTINNHGIDFYFYDEEGKLIRINLMDENRNPSVYIKSQLPEIRQKYNLEKLNEEILKYGKPIKYGKPLY